jgi:hypothetical protein
MPDTILEGNHPGIISAKFGRDWLSGFRGEEFFIFHPRFSIFSLAAVLVGSRDHRTQIWKAATQGSFQQSLVEIGSLVLEEKIFIKFNTSSESSGRSAPRTFSKYIEIVSLSTTHFVLRVGFTAD